MKGTFSGKKIMMFVVFFSQLLTMHASAVKVNFNGTLIEYYCQIESDSITTVTFLNRSVKYFHEYPGKSPAQKFSIKLGNCNNSAIGKTVKIKFTGEEEKQMNRQSDYFLKVSGSNEGKLAVGLLDTDGITQLKLGAGHNKGKGTQIGDNAVALDFYAFVQVTPDAIKKKSVQPSTYATQVRFEIFYE